MLILFVQQINLGIEPAKERDASNFIMPDYPGLQIFEPGRRVDRVFVLDARRISVSKRVDPEIGESLS